MPSQLTRAGGTPIFAVLALFPFNILLASRVVANGATWMQRTCVAWLAYDLTGSPSFLGLIAFLSFAPAIVMALVGGFVSDRGAPVVLLRGTKSVALLFQAMLAALTIGDLLGPGVLALLALLLGCSEGMQTAPNKVLIWHLVPRELLPVAIPVNSVAINLATIAGPMAGGIVIAGWGVGAAFAVAAAATACFLVVLFIVPADLGRAPAERRQGTFLEDLRSMVASVVANRVVLAAMLFQFAGAFSLKPLVHLMAGLNAEIAGGSPQSFGFMMSAYGSGAILSGLAFAALGGGRSQQWRIVLLATLAGGLAFSVASLVGSYPQSLPFIIVAGMSSIIRVSALQTMVQLAVATDVRGKTMALFKAIDAAGLSLGALAFGAIAEHQGFILVYLIAGLLGAGLAVACLSCRKGLRD